MEHQILSSPIAAGELLAGKYRVERTLGMGGMGVVVAATHLHLHEERAIKLVRPDLAHPHIIERFLREARAVVKLRSEHVAKVFDIGYLVSGTPFIVMELLHGEDLAGLLRKRSTLPIHEAVCYMMQACDALAEAHARGIIHRDLKPANLFLTQRMDGSPCIKVLDFGVSKYIPQDGEAAETEMTSNGDVMGSPLYMAPEQMRAAREVDPRADIWALGSILYKLLTGKAPFQRATTPEIFTAVLGPERAALPSSLRAEIPSGLDAVIMRCLSKVVETRFARVIDLKAALSPYSEPRESYEEEGAFGTDTPRGLRGSPSSRPMPHNIDALLLGCIGKDPNRHAARSPRRRIASDPFMRRVEPREPAPSTHVQADPNSETIAVGGGTIPMVDGSLRMMRPAHANGAPAAESATTKKTENAQVEEPITIVPEIVVDECLSLMPPRLPSFPPPLERTARPKIASLSGLPQTPQEAMGNSVAPWDYAPNPPAKGRAKPVAIASSVMTALFIVCALVLAFTSGKSGAASTASAPPGGLLRPAAGGMPTLTDAPKADATQAPAPLPSASAAAPLRRQH